MDAGKSRTTFRPQLEVLEERLLLHGGHDLGLDLGADLDLAFAPALAASETTTTSSTTTTSPGTTYPLTAIPVLNSLPGAPATLYLDFDGHYEAQWGGYSNVTTPVFDLDGDENTFSDTELAAIQKIWEYVAEDYSPFNLNVTTVEPPSFANGVALRVSIGGYGEWAPSNGGIASINGFTNGGSNTVFVFSGGLLNNITFIGVVASHESGHAFGLQHQTEPTPDDRNPTMIGASTAPRSVWWEGMNSSNQYQDDMAVIAKTVNGFGYRPDDHGNNASTATPFSISGNWFSASGIISTTSDLDYFSFSIPEEGQATFTVGQGLLSSDTSFKRGTARKRSA